MKYLFLLCLIGCQNSTQPISPQVPKVPIHQYDYPEDNFDKAGPIFHPNSKWIFDKDLQVWRKQ